MKHSWGDSRRLTKRERILLAVAALSILALLAIAACLRPDERGYGTHEQLGLPPCAFHALFGRRCPTCGMTTSWSHVMHGEWRAATSANVCGAALAVVALTGALGALAVAMRGGLPAWRPTERQWITAAVVAWAAVLIEWLMRL